MAYQWKLQGLYSVDAETAGKELDRIYRQHGELDPQDVVDESRPETAPLHGLFEWNDAVAAEEYRKKQAMGIIRSIEVVVEDSRESEPVVVRAFLNTQKAYQPLAVVMRNEEMREHVLRDALRDMGAFEKRYRELAELEPVFAEMRVAAEVLRSEVARKPGNVTGAGLVAVSA